MLEKIGQPAHAALSKPAPEAVSLLNRVLETNPEPVVCEIGVGIGATSLELCRTLAGHGQLHLYDQTQKLRGLGRDLAGLGFTNVGLFGSSARKYDNYVWTLAKNLVEQRGRGGTAIYDLIYFNYARAFQFDAAAAVLLKELVADGGYILFNNYTWSLGASPSMKPSVRPETAEEYSDEQIDVPHVRFICDVFFDADPAFEKAKLGLSRNEIRRAYRRIAGSASADTTRSQPRPDLQRPHVRFSTETAQQAQPRPVPEGDFPVLCSVCGEQTSVRWSGARSEREDFSCPSCKATLRYRNQAQILVDEFGRGQALCLDDLVTGRYLDELSIYEAARRGPFVRRLRRLPDYTQSYYWDDVAPGGSRDGLRCEDLRALSFADESFDLVLTSDVLEHVFEPFGALRETYRVLKPGGLHVFTVPVDWPLLQVSEPAAVMENGEVRHLVEPVYHNSGDGGRSLVVTRFGEDLIDWLADIGFRTQVVRRALPTPAFCMDAIFVARKPG